MKSINLPFSSYLAGVICISFISDRAYTQYEDNNYVEELEE